MNTPNASNTQTDLSRVLAKIAEIAEKSADGDYVYRGESKSHCQVSSNLYREYEKDIRAEYFDIEIVQDEILREAREYNTHKMDNLEILTELQHYGGKTNLIDFKLTTSSPSFSPAMATLTNPVELYCSNSSLKLTKS